METIQAELVDNTLAKVPSVSELAEQVQTGLLDVLSIAAADVKERIQCRVPTEGRVPMTNQEAIDFTLGMTSAIAKMG
jgi:hypothetical protein